MLTRFDPSAGSVLRTAGVPPFPCALHNKWPPPITQLTAAQRPFPLSSSRRNTLELVQQTESQHTPDRRLRHRGSHRRLHRYRRHSQIGADRRHGVADVRARNRRPAQVCRSQHASARGRPRRPLRRDGAEPRRPRAPSRRNAQAPGRHARATEIGQRSFSERARQGPAAAIGRSRTRLRGRSQRRRRAAAQRATRRSPRLHGQALRRRSGGRGQDRRPPHGPGRPQTGQC